MFSIFFNIFSLIGRIVLPICVLYCINGLSNGSTVINTACFTSVSFFSLFVVWPSSLTLPVATKTNLPQNIATVTTKATIKGITPAGSTVTKPDMKPDMMIALPKTGMTLMITDMMTGIAMDMMKDMMKDMMNVITNIQNSVRGSFLRPPFFLSLFQHYFYILTYND